PQGVASSPLLTGWRRHPPPSPVLRAKNGRLVARGGVLPVLGSSEMDSKNHPTRREALLAGAGVAGAGLAMPNAVTAAALRAGMAVEEGYAAVPGGKVYWRKIGSGSGTPLLLLHGGPGAPHNYLLSMAALGDERP